MCSYLSQTQKLQNLPGLWMHGIDTESYKFYNDHNQYSSIKYKCKNSKLIINAIPTDPDNEQKLSFRVNIKSTLKFSLTLQLNQLLLLLKIIQRNHFSK